MNKETQWVCSWSNALLCSSLMQKGNSGEEDRVDTESNSHGGLALT